MDLSCSLPPVDGTVEHIEYAESLGYRRVWVNDSPALYRDVWMTLALAAARTDSIGLGVAVTVPGLRHVLVTASAIATLEALAPRRVAVAVGTGFTARCALGQRPLPWSDVARYLVDLRALLSGEAIEVDGKLVQMRHHEGCIPPRPIDIPLLVAANGPIGLRVAREHGDGVVAMGEPRGGFAWSVFGTAGTVLDDGEDLDTPRVFDAVGAAIALAYHFTYEIQPEAVEALPGGSEWLATLKEVPSERRHLEVHEGHLIAPNERERPHLRPELAATTFTGCADDLRARLDDLRARGVTELLYTPMGPDIRRELAAMARVAGVSPTKAEPRP
jgi:5,10-methylenetetrahydromethanopterin reductase